MVVNGGSGTPVSRKPSKKSDGKDSAQRRNSDAQNRMPAPPSLSAVQETRKREATVRAHAKSAARGDQVRSRSRSPGDLQRAVSPNLVSLKRSATPQTHKRNRSVTPQAPPRTSSVRASHPSGRSSPRARSSGAGNSGGHIRGSSASPNFVRMPQAFGMTGSSNSVGSASPGLQKELQYLRQQLAKVTADRDDLRAQLDLGPITRKRGSSRANGTTDNGLLKGIGKEMIHNFGIIFDDLTINREAVLGSGGFGTVYMGDYQATDVAVKVHRADHKWTENELNVWKTEVKIMTLLRHPNILMLLGAVFETERLAIITEYCDGGTLQESLFALSKLGTNVTWGQKLKWMMQICKGMAFLHYKRIFHRDLKAANVFVSGDTMKIADFGLSRFGSKDEKGTATNASQRCNSEVKAAARAAAAGQSLIQGTFAFMAPEVWSELPYTEACDVYSFGVLIIELLGLDIPFERDFEEDCSWRIMTYKSRPRVLSHVGGVAVPRPIQEINHMCIAKPSRRPPFTSLVGMFRKELEAPYASTESAWPSQPHDTWVGVPCSDWPSEIPDPLSDSSPLPSAAVPAESC
ncbi:Dual specificity protein kinase shkB [Diplonema papillatum]|nr:Dual specificity protein kinase shkB [Diplonema papillatum]